MKTIGFRSVTIGLLLFFVGITSQSFCQTDSIVWALTSFPGNGQVIPADATIIPSAVIKGSNLDGNQTLNSTKGYGTSGNNSNGWNESDINNAVTNNAFVEFSFHLNCGRNFIVDSLRFSAQTSSGGNITNPASNSSVKVSIDGSPFTNLVPSSVFPSNVTSGNEVALNFNLNPNISLKGGQTIAFRIYAAKIGAKTDTLYIRNFVIKGTKSSGAINATPGSAIAICSGTNTNISVSSITGGVAPYNVSWNNGGGSCTGVLENGNCTNSVSPGATTTYTALITDANGCTANFTQTVTVNQPSVAPSNITGNSTICNGQSTTLTLSGGSLGTGATFKWYSGSCGGTPVGNGTSITVSPTLTTTYFVRAEGTSAPCTSNSTCAQTTVAVNQPSVAPSNITGTSTICIGQSTTLTLTGGSLGTSASFKWYSGSCGGTSEGSGTAITVSPTVTTTYFVRAEGTSAPCASNSTCAQITVIVNQPSVAPSGVTGSSVICTGQSTTLTRQGGTLGTNADFVWYSGSCGGVFVGTGPSITVNPLVTTTYFVRIEGTASPCSTTPTACAQITVTVNLGSQPPTSIGGTIIICNGQPTTLNQIGGVLGTNATFEWYSGTCGGTPEGSGSSITVSPVVTTTYFVRVEGTSSPCTGNTNCTQVTVTVNQPSVAPTSISGTSTICVGQSTTLTVGGGVLGTGAAFKWYSGTCGGTPEGNSASITVNPTVTTTYFVRIEGTSNPCVTTPTACASLTVIVNQPSVAPSNITGTSTICNGQSTLLTLTGGSLGTGATFEWYSGSCGGTSVGNGISITVSPTVTTTYFVRAEGTNPPCNANTSCTQITVNVNQPSTAPSGINISDLVVCTGDPTTLTELGGTLGTNATFQWYKGACGGAGSTPVGSSSSITLNPINNGTSPITQEFFVRAENTQSPCTANTGCASRTIIINPIPVRTNITSPDTICSGQPLDDTIVPSFSNGVTYSWSTSGPSIVTGNQSQFPASSNATKPEILINTTTNQQPSVTYIDTVIFTNIIQCISIDTFVVVVNPAAPKATVTDLTAINGSIPDNLCGGTQFNSFNVTNGAIGIGYTWIASPSNVIVHHPDSLNTVISFPDSNSAYTATIIATSVNQISLGGCPNDSTILTIEVSAGDPIQEDSIKLKQPGNLLVYLDNTAQGFEWGFDSKNTLLPTKIEGQVYQALHHPVTLPFDTLVRDYWVLVYKNNCVTKVYYNGDYGRGTKNIEPLEVPDNVTVTTFPNPNNGVFDVVVSGNIYQNININIWNNLGQKIYQSSRYKSEALQKYTVSLPELATGLYMIDVSGSHGEQATQKILIK